MCGRRLLPRGRKLPRPRETLLRRRRNNRRNNRNSCSSRFAGMSCNYRGFAADRFRRRCIFVRLRGHRIVVRIRGHCVRCPLSRTWRNGRRKGLKIPWGKPCAGSSPAVRTNKITAQLSREACKLGCEAIVSRRFGSPCRSGRSTHWVKVKIRKRQRQSARHRRIGGDCEASPGLCPLSMCFVGAPYSSRESRFRTISPTT